MNWNAIGAIADIVGAMAVVVTLIYLAYEIRLSRRVNESATVDALATGWNSLNTHIVDDAELAEVRLKGFPDPDSLDPIQLVRFLAIGQSYINHFMTVKKHHDAVSLAEDQWLVHAAGLAHIMCSPGGKYICENVTITPDVLETIHQYHDERYEDKDGYLGIRKHYVGA